jgi:hypothetical protein
VNHPAFLAPRVLSPSGSKSTRSAILRRIVSFTAALLVAGSLAAVDAAPATAATTTRIHWDGYTQRMVQSTGNLYFTENLPRLYDPVEPSPPVPAKAQIRRISKQSSGPQPPKSVLYSISHDGDLHFDALTWAKVGTTWLGFVVANDPKTLTSQILRFSLSGDTALTKVSSSPRYIGKRDIAADANGVYWADEGGIRRAPVTGGNASALTTGSTMSRLGLSGGNIYYQTAGRELRRIQPNGKLNTLVRTTTSDITALSVTGSRLMWGEVNGTIGTHSLATGVATTYRGPTSNVVIQSVFWTGTTAVWSECRVGGSCAIYRRAGKAPTLLRADRGLELTGDDSNLFWVAPSGLYRYTA